MTNVVLLSNDEALVRDLTARLTGRHRIAASQIHTFGWRTTGEGDPDWVAQTHAELVDAIEACVNGASAPAGLRRTLGVIDLGDLPTPLHEMDLTELHNWSAVAPMVVLTFPEIYWVLRATLPLTHGAKPTDAAARLLETVHRCEGAHGIDRAMQLSRAGFEPLFDPAGLRNTLRDAVGRTDRAHGGSHILRRPLRPQAAAAIDEEEAYTYFTAYTAYRIGHRAHMVTSYAMASALFGSAEGAARVNLPALAADAPMRLLFEDLFLGFPDKPSRLQLSDLTERAQALPGLEVPQQRVFVTVGERGHMREKIAANDAYLDTQRRARKHIGRVHKPLPGLYGIWKESGIKPLNGIKGCAPGFQPDAGTGVGVPEGGHSTPGRLYAIATRLLFRCRALAREASSVADALHGALLALEAQELLGGRTPTISLEAISLKHEMEVVAECMFYGLEHHLDVEERYKDLEEEVTRVSRWFNPGSEQLSRLNALSTIVSVLVRRYREYNRFDEEQAAQAKLRDLHRYLSMERLARAQRETKIRGAKWVPRVVGGIRWYVDLLLGSVKWFLIILLGWTVLLWAIFTAWPSNATAKAGILKRAFQGLADAVSTFFGASPPMDLADRGWGWPLLLVGAAGVILAFFHLGIFISHLYGIVTRK